MAKKKQPNSGKGETGPELDIRTIRRDVEFLGSSRMTWKERKELENKKVVSLGGKAPKKQRLPLSVARPMMKNQKKREEKMWQENIILQRFGGKSSSWSSAGRPEDRRKPEDRVLKSIDGHFKKGVLNVKHLLQPTPSGDGENNKRKSFGGKGKKKAGKKSGGKKRGGKKRH
ncbi:hypothetical protein EUGRSUZ_J02277 [Eucalyptus grandis]|uniref:Uncharacterized protein n=3 Tax=Eucalyptus grandis TaxID=71139 RepID=A0A059AG33_EUCGR|nr:hypothetical protein EUGRSUZ_J02277 [Eucalyptus grandis]KAK3410277.1 hypothetical protein EUGRSUZ_J02277 [Eucalyptus grandis]